MDWNLGHKRLCKIYNKMTSSTEFSQLARHERMDVLLLSHFLARVISTPNPVNSPLTVFLSLLPAPSMGQEIANILPQSLTRALEGDLPHTVYHRFNNNNFTIHSHMNTIGHGVFPLASRLFNHSCMPNAAPRYVLTPAHPVTMEVIALQNIVIGEEVR